MTDTKSALVEALLGDIIKEISEKADTRFSEIESSFEKRATEIQTRASESLSAIDAILQNKPLIVNFGTIEKPDNVITHSAFRTIIKILESTKRKEKNIMLVGGAGGGKTHLVKQVSDSLKLPFYPLSVGLQTTKSDLMGFINANGVYITSVVREAFENGGVLLLDEFDAAHSGVVTILNSLLANNHSSFPDRVITKHKDFICLCACNTYGKGANIEYVGRNKLDAATLDRFVVVDVDYDTSLENRLTNHESWFKTIQKIRDNIISQGIKMVVSPRASMDGADLLDGGFTVDEVLSMTVFKGADEDIKKKILKGIDLETLKTKEAKPPKAKKLKKPKIKITNPDDSLYIDVDFNQNTYSTNLWESFDVKSDNWNGVFKISCDSSYTTYLESRTLYINPNVEDCKFDKPEYINEACIDAFIEDIKQNHKTYTGTPFTLTIKYKENIFFISFGE